MNSSINNTSLNINQAPYNLINHQHLQYMASNTTTTQGILPTETQAAMYHNRDAAMPAQESNKEQEPLYDMDAPSR